MEFYLDGGPVTGGLASTIVDCTRDEPVFLRVGAISEADVMDVVQARADAIELNAVGPEPTEHPDDLETPEGPQVPKASTAPTGPRPPRTPSSEGPPTMTDTFYGSDFGALEAAPPRTAAAA